MATERRKNPRFGVRSNAFAFLNCIPDKLIPIVNISLGGIGIGVNAINMNADGSSAVSRLEILTDDCHFYMDRLPYQLLLPHRNLSRDVNRPFQHVFGVQFIDLMPSQQNRLKSFIGSHTFGGKTPKLLHKFNQHLHQFIGKKELVEACHRIGLQRTSF